MVRRQEMVVMRKYKNEHRAEAYGVKGLFRNVVVWPEGTTPERAVGRIANQTFTATRETEEGALMVTVRFDDNCRNGHESLAINGDHIGRGGVESFGCIHDKILKWFPEFGQLIPYHLCSVDGPLHYLENTIYLAGDRDCWGLRSGEAQYRNQVSPRNDAQKKSLSKTTLHGCDIPAKYDWAESKRRVDAGEEGNPDAVRRWLPVTYIDPNSDIEGFEMKQLSPVHRFGEGKERELDAARKAAIWPDATDEILCSEVTVLKAALIERLPGLMEKFESLIRGFGFYYNASEIEG